MTEYCHYHQKQPAIYECETCHRLYGQCCLLPSLPNQQCSLCEVPVKSLGAANTAEPFWDQINSFFRYPFQAAPLGLLVVCAVTLSVIGDGIVALVAYVALASVFTKYAYSIIQASKDGITQPPSFQSAFSGDNLNLFFKQIAVFILAGLAITPFALTGSEFMIITASFLINGLMPASIVVLALTGSILAALNLALLFSVVRAIGKRYILLWLFLFILAQGPAILLSLLFGAIPDAALTPIVIFLTGYFALVMCRLLGYTVYQNQGELGFVSDENEEPDNLTDAQREELITKQTVLTCELMVKEGEYQRARKLVSDRLNQQADDLTLEEYYHRLLVVTEDREAVIKNADMALEAFVRSQRMDLAIGTLTDCLKFDKSYRPGNLSVTISLARSLQSKLKSNLVIQLLNGVHKRFPDDNKVAEAYLLLADIFINNKNDLHKGHQYIAYIKKHFPSYGNNPKLLELTRDIEQGSLNPG